MSVAQVAPMRPPITARPRGAVCSPPSLRPNAIGIIPAIIAKLVIRIGRRRLPAPSIAASHGSRPSARLRSAKVTSRMAFATATPVAMITRPISLLTTIVAAALLGFLAIDRMARDIFPDLGVPVLYVAQPYGGLDPAQMEGFIVSYYEYHFLFITGIEHVESKSIQGVGLIKLQFHPGTNMAQAVAETVSYVDRARAFMPTGTLPPFVMRFDGGSVPVGDLHSLASFLRSPSLPR
jgi:hypothetical protein